MPNTNTNTTTKNTTTTNGNNVLSTLAQLFQITTLSGLVSFLVSYVASFNTTKALEDAKKTAEKALEDAKKTDSYKAITTAEKALKDAEKALEDAKRTDSSIRDTDVFQLACFVASVRGIDYTSQELTKLASDYGLSSTGQFGYFRRVIKLAKKINLAIDLKQANTTTLKK